MTTKKIFIPIFLLLTVLLPYLTTHAQLTTAQRAQLEQELAKVQAEQQQAQSSLATAQKKSSSLQNDLAVLAAKIKSEQLDIQAKNLLIQTLGDSITTKQSEINSLDAKIDQEKTEIADIFREINNADSVSTIEIMLTSDGLSGFINDYNSLSSLESDIYSLSLQLQANVSSSTVEKAALVERQNSAIDARYAIQQAQASVKIDQANQAQLLAISKNNEKAYTTLVAQKKSEAAAISAKLFALAGGSNPIPFGQAYQYALTASQKTGIDPAFLLAILTQESNLGTNQGTCYLTNSSTGAGVSVKSGNTFKNVMSPNRDVPPFLSITSALGVDPYRTVVSCPQSIGWGGAMGPAQFIASTWKLFTSRIQKALGTSSYANPWNPEHAFMASALYLTDLGAASKSYTTESNAACKYYSGSSCSKSALIASYGTSVMSLASKIQRTEIDKL